jgi:hypothetical protein
MDDLRSEIRAAFEREQRAHPPTGGLRDDILDAVTMNPRRSPNLQWLAVAAAVILAALVVIGLMATRFHPRATVPAATPNASPVADYGPPPAGVPLLYVKDPSHPSWLIGFDWTGTPRGTVKLDPAIGAVGMAPDGQSFAVGFGAKGGTGQILDRLGQPIQGAGGAIPGSALPIWADDNQHTCGISFDSQTGTYSLLTLAPGQPVQGAAVLPSSQNGPGSYRLASCSFRNDEALVVRSSQWPAELLSVRLSSGKVTSRYTYASPEQLSNVVASGDSKFIAENSGQSVGQAGTGAPNTTIRRVQDRTVVATLPPTTGVLAFNSDDSRVFVYTTPWAGGAPTALAVIDIQSGQSIWTYNGPGMFGNVVAEPGGRDFAIYVRKPAVEDPLTDLMIVHADGTATDFPRRFQPAW